MYGVVGQEGYEVPVQAYVALMISWISVGSVR